MYPLADQFLSIHEIARHWSRDLPQRPLWEEDFNTLLTAVWNGACQRPG